jgi:hypothetical protein
MATRSQTTRDLPARLIEVQTSLNQQIAMKLAQAADLLEQQGANPFRVSAYRRASETVSNWPKPRVRPA